MSDPRTNQLYDRAIQAWGLDAQLGMLQEESAEVIVAVSKVMREPCSETLDALAEELADAEIMIGQIRRHIGDEAVDKHKARKLERLEMRLNRG